MNTAERNRERIRQRIREIDRRIKALEQEKVRLVRDEGDPHLTFDPSEEISDHARNAAKIKTLGRARSILRKVGHPLKTSGLVSLILEATSEDLNPITIRSHLRRLKLEGKLIFDKDTKCWLVPELAIQEE